MHVRRHGATQEELRRHNLGTLLRIVHELGPLTRADLTVRMGLNRSTIKGLVAELTALGVLREERPGPVRGGAGRPSLLVRPRPDRVQVLAADVGVDRVVVALVGLGGAIVARRRHPITERAPEAVASLIRRLVEVVRGDPAGCQKVVGFGVSVPGIVRHSDGCVRFAPNLGWTDAPIGDLITREIGGGPVTVGNDGDLGLRAEHRRGAARGVEDVVFVASAIGVGGGLVIGGRPLAGAGGYAGELGHIVVRPGGRRCRCGAKGCWETEIGAAAIARALGLSPHAGAEHLVTALGEVDPAAGSLDQVGHFLGLGMASIVNLVNPRLFVVGGLLRQVYPLVEPAVHASLSAAALSAPAEQVRVAVAKLGDDAALIGASELAWSDLLAHPIDVLRGVGENRARAR